MNLSLGLGRDNKRIFWATFFDEGGLGVFITLLPLYIASLGATPAQVGLVLGLSGVAQLLMLLPSGMLADRIPPRRMIVIARALGVLGLLIMGLAQEWWQVIPGTVVMAVGIMAWPLVSNVITEGAGDGRQRTRAFTMIYSIGPSAALLFTPALGGVIAEGAGLRAIFFAAVVLRTISTILFSTIQSRPVPERSTEPAGYRATLSHRPIRLVCLLEFGTLFVLALGLTLVPNFLQDIHAINLGRIGWLGSFSAVGSIVLGLLVTRLSIFSGPLRAMIFVVSVVGGALLILLLGGSYWWFILAFVLRGGLFITWSLYYAALSEITPERYRTRVYALVELLGTAGFATAPFVAGPLYGIDPRLPLVVSLILLGPLLIGIMWLGSIAGTGEPVKPEERATTN